jgi:predicted regulator of Ras-like GTPase activity (Roadblock/LC7/MglB family)
MDLAASSEVREAAALLKKFSSHRRPAGVYSPPASRLSSPVISGPVPAPESTSPPQTHSTAGRKPVVRPPQDLTPRVSAPESKGGRIEELLESMCLRGQFAGAVVADQGGLAVAEYNCPVESEAVAACSSVLGGAMERAGDLLEQQEANHMTMDINYVDKVVLRQFAIEGDTYYLLVICPQEVDERSELELSIDRIAVVLGRRT